MPLDGLGQEVQVDGHRHVGERRRRPSREADEELAEGEPGNAALGWLLAQHRFDDYRSKKDAAEQGARILLTQDAAGIEAILRLALAVRLP